MKYRYTHDVPNVFIDLVKDGHTWVPNKGDTITTDTAVNHPYLELVEDEVEQETPVETKQDEPEIAVQQEKPTAIDDGDIEGVA